MNNSQYKIPSPAQIIFTILFRTSLVICTGIWLYRSLKHFDFMGFAEIRIPILPIIIILGVLTEGAALKMYAACIRDKRYFNTYGDYPEKMGGASVLNIALCIYIVTAFLFSVLSYGVMVIDNFLIDKVDAEIVEIGSTVDFYSINPFEKKQKCTKYTVKYADAEINLTDVCPAFKSYNVGDTVEVHYFKHKPDIAVIFEYEYDSDHVKDYIGFVFSIAACIFVFSRLVDGISTNDGSDNNTPELADDD